MLSGTSVPNTKRTSLEQIQNEAARIVTGATKLVSIQSLRSETGWESLTSRREKHKLILYYKMQNGLTPDFLSSLVPPTVGSTTTYNLRNFSNLQTVHASSQLYYRSFLHQLREAGMNCLKIREIQHQWQFSKVNFNAM